METMNYISTTNANFDLSYSNSTAMPGPSIYLLKDLAYIPLEPALYRLNMPLIEKKLYNISTTVVDKTQQEDDEFNTYLNDALKRYKEINNGAVFDVTRADSFLQTLKIVCNTMRLQPYIMFNKFATKVQLVFNNKDFVLDYDHEDPDSVFVLSQKDETLIVKESTLDKLEKTLRSF